MKKVVIVWNDKVDGEIKWEMVIIGWNDRVGTIYISR